MRAGDLIRYQPTGEHLVVAYVLGQSVSVHELEPHEHFVARTGADTEASPRRIQHEGRPCHAHWPTRRWATAEGAEDEEAHEHEEEILVHASDVVLVREASDEEHESVLLAQARREIAHAPHPLTGQLVPVDSRPLICGQALDALRQERALASTERAADPSQSEPPSADASSETL